MAEGGGGGAEGAAARTADQARPGKTAHWSSANVYVVLYVYTYYLVVRPLAHILHFYMYTCTTVWLHKLVHLV